MNNRNNTKDKINKFIEQSNNKKTKKIIKFKGDLINAINKGKIRSNALKYGRVYFVCKKPFNYINTHKKKAYTKKTNKESFAYGLNFYKLFWVFIIGCIVGVIAETIFGLVVDHRLESRSGLIYGPFNPVYGFGAVGLTLTLYRFQNKNFMYIFVLGGIVGGAFEYICSFYQEIFMGTVSWDYSDQFGNINGRTSILYMAMWGVLATLWIKVIFPFLTNVIEKIPNKSGKIITWILLIFMIFNCCISGAAVNRMTRRDEGRKPRNVFDKFLDYAYPDEYLDKIYNHMTYVSTGKDTQGEDTQKHNNE